MRNAAARERQSDTTRPRALPPRLRLAGDEMELTGVTYDSENYAMINRPIETGRHAWRIMRYLRPESRDCLLEVGCGRGWLTQRVQQSIPETWGVDVNPKSIENGVTEQLSVMDALDLRFEDEQFDHCFSFHAIEHIVEAERALAEMARVIKPGGRILLVYPAEPVRGLYAMPGAWLGFGNPLLARKLHVHAFTPKRISVMAARTGLVPVESALDILITPQFMSVLEKPR